MKRIIFCIFTTIAFSAVCAQTPTLIGEIIPGRTGSIPTKGTEFKGKLYVAATDSIHGVELWTCDKNHTFKMVADLNPGLAHGVLTGNNTGVERMAILGDKLYFPGTDASNNNVLRAYDAVSPPLVVVTNPNKPATSYYLSLTALGNRLYYINDTSSTGIPFGFLMSYDAVNGEILRKPLGVKSVQGNHLPNLTAYNGKLYFGADSTGIGNELFVFDPATDKCSLVADIATGSRGSEPDRFTVGGGKLYFTAEDSAHGIELYSYDGTIVKRLTDVYPGVNDGIPFSGRGNITYYRGGIYFVGNNSLNNSALYKYNTFTQATSRVYDAVPGANDVIQELYSSGNNLYFSCRTTSFGSEVYKYNDTTFGMVADLRPGPQDGIGGQGPIGTGVGSWNIADFTLFDGNIYFTGNDSAVGGELYSFFDTPSRPLPSNVAGQNANRTGEAILYPNPVSSSATLDIKLQNAQSLCISLSDLTGREMYTSGMKSFTAGKHEVMLPMQNLPAGQYFYRINSNSGVLLAAGTVIKE